MICVTDTITDRESEQMLQAVSRFTSTPRAGATATAVAGAVAGAMALSPASTA